MPTLFQSPKVDAPTINLKLSALPDYLGPVEPTPELVRDVYTRGVIEPIILKDLGGRLPPKQRYKVITGRRRIMAARLTGCKEIPARIFPAAWEDDAILMLILHDQRRENPLTDLQAVEELLERGSSEREICLQTNIPQSKLTRILTLRNLIPEMRAAVNEGKLKPSVAVLVARLTKALQQELLAVLRETGRIKVKDIRDVQQTKRSEATCKLPFEVFHPQQNVTWKEVCLLKLKEMQKLFVDNKVPESLNRKLLELEQLVKKAKKM